MIVVPLTDSSWTDDGSLTTDDRPPTTDQPDCPSAPPLDVTLLDLLLARHPAVAARVLIAMPQRRRWAQLCAYAALLDVPTTRLQHEWADLFSHTAPPNDAPRVCAPLDPVDCALLGPADLAAALRAMTPAQRMNQAVAQAAWLQGFGFPVTTNDMLRAWNE